MSSCLLEIHPDVPRHWLGMQHVCFQGIHADVPQAPVRGEQAHQVKHSVLLLPDLLEDSLRSLELLCSLWRQA